MKTIKIATVLCAAALACSCNLLDKDSVAVPIRVNVVGTEDTKALTVISSLQSGFVLDAWVDDDYMDNSNTITERHYIESNAPTPNVTYSAGAWSITGNPKWISGLTTRFWARYPASVNGTLTVNDPSTPDAASISFDYSTPITAEESDDIVFAYAEKKHKAGDPNEDTIDLTFSHAMAQVRFAVCTTDGSFDTNFEILSIVIEDLKKKGTCTYTPANAQFSRFEWTGLSEKFSMSQEYDAVFTPSVDSNWIEEDYKSGHKLYVASQTFFIIPQEMHGLDVTIRFNKNGILESNTVTINDSYTFSEGKTYTFKINAVPANTTFSDPVSLNLIGISHENYTDGGKRPF